MTRYITLAEYWYLAEQVTGINAATLVKASRVDLADSVVEIELIGDEVEARDQQTAERRERTREPARRARALDRRHVDPVVLVVHLREPLEASGEQPYLRR